MCVDGHRASDFIDSYSPTLLLQWNLFFLNLISATVIDSTICAAILRLISVLMAVKFCKRSFLSTLDEPQLNNLMTELQKLPVAVPYTLGGDLFVRIFPILKAQWTYKANMLGRGLAFCVH